MGLPGEHTVAEAHQEQGIHVFRQGMAQRAHMEHVPGWRQGCQRQGGKAAFHTGGNVLERDTALVAEAHHLIHQRQHCLPDLAVLALAYGEASLQQLLFFLLQSLIGPYILQQGEHRFHGLGSGAGSHQGGAYLRKRIDQPLTKGFAGISLGFAAPGEGLCPAYPVDAVGVGVVFQQAAFIIGKGRIAAFHQTQHIPIAVTIGNGPHGAHQKAHQPMAQGRQLLIRIERNAAVPERRADSKAVTVGIRVQHCDALHIHALRHQAKHLTGHQGGFLVRAEAIEGIDLLLGLLIAFGGEGEQVVIQVTEHRRGVQRLWRHRHHLCGEAAFGQHVHKPAHALPHRQEQIAVRRRNAIT